MAGCRCCSSSSRSSSQAPRAALRCPSCCRSWNASVARAARQETEVAAERGGAGPGVMGGDGVGGEVGGDREAVAQCLGHRDDVGRHVPVLRGEPAAGAVPGGLDLVGDQQRAVPAAQPPQLRPVVVGRDDDAAVALDRLGDHGRDRLAPQQALQRGQAFRVPRTRDGVGRHQRVRVGSPHVQAGDAHGPLGPAVQAVVQIDALLPSGGQRGQQQRALVGLAAAGAEEAAAQAGRRHFGDRPGQFQHRLGQVDRRRVLQAAQLLDGRLEDFRVGVPGVHHRDAAEAVEIAPARRRRRGTPPRRAPAPAAGGRSGRRTAPGTRASAPAGVPSRPCAFPPLHTANRLRKLPVEAAETPGSLWRHVSNVPDRNAGIGTLKRAHNLSGRLLRSRFAPPTYRACLR